MGISIVVLVKVNEIPQRSVDVVALRLQQRFVFGIVELPRLLLQGQLTLKGIFAMVVRERFSVCPTNAVVVGSIVRISDRVIDNGVVGW